MNAAFRPSARARAKASAIRSRPVIALTLGDLVELSTTKSPFVVAGSSLRASLAQQRQRLLEVLVSATREAHEVQLARRRVAQHPRQRVGTLERGDDALQASGPGERFERLSVG